MKAHAHLTAIWALLLGSATVYSQVELTDNVAISGFVDAAYISTDDGTTKSETLDLQGAEVDFLFNLDTVSGEVHLQTDGTTLELEQAFVTYDLGNGLTVTAGRYLSLLGFESDESVTRYTNSRAYDLTSLIPLYNDGVKLETVTDQGWIAISILDEVWTGSGSGTLDNGNIGVEVQAGFTGQQGFTAVIGYGGQDRADNVPAIASGEIYNIWVSYETGALILAAEYNDFANSHNPSTGDYHTGDSIMVLARYAINEKSSITGRYTEEQVDPTATTGAQEAKKWSVAPHYSFTDNLAGRIEYSRTDYTGVTGKDEVDFFAIEAMFTF